MKLTFPYWGNYTIAFKSLIEKLGIEVIPPERTNPEAIQEGAKISPEMYCFPLKVNIGNYLAAIKKGADTILMVTSLTGSCRLRYYGIIQDKALAEAGYKVKIITFGQGPKDIYLTLKEISGASSSKILKAIYFCFKELKIIEGLEKKAQHFRPREKIKGKTDETLRKAFLELEEIKELKELSEFKKKIFKEIAEIEIDKDKNPSRVGLIGEIYTVSDSAINFGIEEKLGKEGIEVQREMDVSYHVKKGIFPWKDWQIQRKIMPYLQSTVGGHGRDAIYEMLDYIKKDFDGIIHLLPYGCFVKDTGITVEGYLQKPIQDIKMGEKVLTHKGEFKKVTKTFRRDYKGQILKVDCGGKLNLEITPEHPVLLAKSFVRNHKKIIQGLDFVPTKEAKKGDFIAIPIPKGVKNLKSFEWQKEYRRKPKWEDIKKFPYSPELLRMLGYWLAEGSIHREEKRYVRGVYFSFARHEKDYINDIIDIIKNNFRARIGQDKRPDRPNSAELYIGNRNLGEIILALCGERCDTKILHNNLMTLEAPLQKEILKGFFRGDGCFTDKYGETTYRGVTTSKNLATQLFWLLVRNRIKPSFVEQHIKNRKLSYMLKIANAEGIKRLEDERLTVTNRKNYVRFRELKDYFLAPIREIETIDFEGKVYNLEVKDHHSYVANFLACHNCMPEVTVRPILEKIHLQSRIPFLSLSLDEQVAEAGIDTRIEAFVDVVKNYHQNKNSKKII